MQARLVERQSKVCILTLYPRVLDALIPQALSHVSYRVIVYLAQSYAESRRETSLRECPRKWVN